jgi:hypothetical protein
MSKVSVRPCQPGRAPWTPDRSSSERAATKLRRSATCGLPHSIARTAIGRSIAEVAAVGAAVASTRLNGRAPSPEELADLRGREPASPRDARIPQPDHSRPPRAVPRHVRCSERSPSSSTDSDGFLLRGRGKGPRVPRTSATASRWSDQRTKITSRIPVMASETSSEPMQPSRLLKKKNIETLSR